MANSGSTMRYAIWSAQSQKMRLPHLPATSPTAATSCLLAPVTGGGSVYRGFADASPFAAGLLALGFCELFDGLFWFVC